MNVPGYEMETFVVVYFVMSEKKRRLDQDLRMTLNAPRIGQFEVAIVITTDQIDLKLRVFFAPGVHRRGHIGCYTLRCMDEIA